MTAAYAFSDMLVLAKRSLLRVRRQPDLLVGYTVQPIMFVLLFLYVFGRAIQVPGPWQAQFPDLRDYTGVAWYRRTFQWSEP